MASASPLQLKVTLREPPSLVVPAEPVNENQGVLYLSNLDQNIAVTIETLYFFQGHPPSPAASNASENGLHSTAEHKSHDVENGQSNNGQDTATQNGKNVFPLHLKEHSDPARVLKDALAKVLVFYYPLTGRLGISQEGKLEVRLTGEGMVFVEAEANLSLAELEYDVANPNPQVAKQLVYRIPGATNILQIPPVVVQVTKFKCGGWVLGLGNNHCLFDGGGAMNFVNSWAEMARGEKSLSVKPVLDRSMLRSRSPPQINYPHGEFAEIEDLSREKNMLLQDDLVHASFCFTPEDLETLKRKALEEEGDDAAQDSEDPTNEQSHSNGSSKKRSQAQAEETAALPGSRVTTFEALAAHVWRARTLALAMNDKQQTKLLFAVDGRKKLDPPLPKGFLGNGIALAHAITTASELTNRPLSYAVGLVQEAIRMITGEYIRSAIDFFEVTRARPSLVATFVITTWSRLEFHTTDFGWGEPVLTGPATLPEREAVLFVPHGAGKKSMNVLISLPPAAMMSFKQQVGKF